VKRDSWRKEDLIHQITKALDDETPEPDQYVPIDNREPVEEELLEADEIQHEAFDKYISARVFVPQGDSKAYGTVKRRKRDSEGDLIGRSNKNPLLDTSIYEVEFDSGKTEAYKANIIAESIYSQVDDDGYTTFALKEIIDHTTDGSALTLDNAYTITKTGTKRLQQTTKGWQLCVRWNDESTSWAALKDLKDSDPIKVAKYVVNMKIALEPAFAWWVPHTLKKRHRMIKAMKKPYF
jgi:hypothetical protein